jgi:hypothetical protein
LINFCDIDQDLANIMANFAALQQSHSESMAFLLLADDRCHPKPLFYEEFISSYRSKKRQLHSKGGHIA